VIPERFSEDDVRGAKKLLTVVYRRQPRWALPGRSTVCDLLSRHGMAPKKQSRRRIGHPGKLTSSEIRNIRNSLPNTKGRWKKLWISIAKKS